MAGGGGGGAPDFFAIATRRLLADSSACFRIPSASVVCSTKLKPHWVNLTAIPCSSCISFEVLMRFDSLTP